MKKLGKLSEWTVNLIQQIKPKFWCIENPAGTALHKQKYMENLPKTECSQCQYNRPYQKNTTIWNNFELKLKTCTCTKKHAVTLGRNYGGTPGCRKWAKKRNKIRIPTALVEAIAKQLLEKLKFKLPIQPEQHDQKQQIKEIPTTPGEPNTLIETKTTECTLPLVSQIRSLGKDLKEISVSTYMDKNDGAGITMCKKLHWMNQKATFNDDTDHYEISNLNNTQILSHMKKFYQKMKLEPVQPFSDRADVPYSYTLLKYKDIKRARPIVSYYNHPLKKNFQPCKQSPFSYH